MSANRSNINLMDYQMGAKKSKRAPKHLETETTIFKNP